MIDTHQAVTSSLIVATNSTLPYLLTLSTVRSVQQGGVYVIPLALNNIISKETPFPGQRAKGGIPENGNAAGRVDL